jgi:hypothetical protein
MTSFMFIPNADEPFLSLGGSILIGKDGGIHLPHTWRV